MQHGELQLHRSTIRRANGQKVCLSLTVIPQLPSWNTSTLFVRCETNATSEASSRWYKLKEKWEFEGQDFRFDPQVTWNPKKPTDEAVKTTEETFMSHTIPVKPFDDTTHGPTANLPTSAKPITQQSTAHQPSSVPLTTVVAAAAGAAAFLILLLVLVVILFKKVKEQRNEIEMTNEEIDEFMLGVTAEKANAKGINGLFILPYDTKLEIPKSGVIFRKPCNTILLKKSSKIINPNDAPYCLCHRLKDTRLRSIWSSSQGRVPRGPGCDQDAKK